jgi:acetyl-CoA carboxylase biotin carboxyl carrier protein
MSITKLAAPTTGIVWQITSMVGSRVEAEMPVLLLESMKMEVPVPAPHAGSVLRLLVAEGDAVTEGQILAEIERLA